MAGATEIGRVGGVVCAALCPDTAVVTVDGSAGADTVDVGFAPGGERFVRTGPSHFAGSVSSG